MSQSAIDHAFFNGISSSSNFSTSLTTQTLLESQKNELWKRNTLDRLEQIGRLQLIKNIEFSDYYKMLAGDLVYSDYGISDINQEIVRLRDEIDMPVTAKHFDFLGIIVNQIKGEYATQKDKFRVDTTDPFSQNEFTREQDAKIRDYTEKLFNLELEHKLLEQGFNTDPNQKFNSDEEKQQYLQELQRRKDELIPPEVIQKQLLKSFKTVAAEWAERTLEYDQQRFDMDALQQQEIESTILTGRFFRHYHVGYDSYNPENWDSRTTFFSEDVNTKYPQDGEYVGRITWMSPSDIIQRWGTKIDEETQKRLSGYFNQLNNTGGAQVSGAGLEDSFRGNFGETHHTPFDGYYDYNLTLQLQEVFNQPLGEETVYENGEEKKVPAWFSPMHRGQNFLTNPYARELRTDIDVRHDLLQVTEAYWRSYKRVGILNYITDDGYLDQVFTTDDLLKEYLTENDIKVLRKVSLEEVENNPTPNTIAYTWIPEVRWGVKIRAAQSFLLKNLYIGGDALEYQIKGDSNIYDVKLPVAGYIGNSIAKKLRPFIIMHNIVLNQIYSLLEKELGTFFLFDVHYLPAEYKNNGNTREALEQMYDLITDLGIVPVDTSKANMQGNQPAMNAFMTQSLNFTEQINNRMNLAAQFKLQGLEQIGITPQRLGTPSEYSTAEGIKQGMTATMAQTEPLFSVMSSANKRAASVHLTVAQYYQKNFKDYSFIYTKSDGDKAFIELSDPDFNLREFGVVPFGNSKERKDMETLRQALLNDNTITKDILDIASILSADSLSSLMAYGKQNRIEQDKKEQAQREHEQSLVDKQLAAAKEKEQSDRDQEVKLVQLKNEGALEKAYVDASGRAADKVSDQTGYDKINEAYQLASDNELKNLQIQDQTRRTDLEEKKHDTATDIELKKINLQLEKLKVEREKIAAQKFTSIINKN